MDSIIGFFSPLENSLHQILANQLLHQEIFANICVEAFFYLRTLLSFIAIMLLVTSGFPIGFADTTPTDSSTEESIEAPVVKSRKIISISLEESVGISSGPTKKKQIDNIHNNVNSNESSLKFINLDEDLTLRTTTTDQSIHLDLFVVQPQTII